MMTRKNVLYAPGLRQDYVILNAFREQLKSWGYIFNYIDFIYDEGDFTPQFYNCITDNTSEWWIGISLGASVLYYLYNFAAVKPIRITIINPFSDRKQLSIEKGFDLSNQWNFAPKSAEINVKHIDLVTSVYDKSISMYHGIELLNKAKADTKNVIFVDADHRVSCIKVQKELAKCLHDMGNVRGKINDGYMYCNIYQWKRNIF
ncbi:hypothetical protein QYZ88_007655 [Lachnospiraceae bacterium C1.1]|nr:hypothetical protein [Lachnospiraceae bacterium C1.1]